MPWKSGCYNQHLRAKKTHTLTFKTLLLLLIVSSTLPKPSSSILFFSSSILSHSLTKYSQKDILSRVPWELQVQAYSASWIRCFQKLQTFSQTHISDQHPVAKLASFNSLKRFPSLPFESSAKPRCQIVKAAPNADANPKGESAATPTVPKSRNLKLARVWALVLPEHSLQHLQQESLEHLPIFMDPCLFSALCWVHLDASALGQRLTRCQKTSWSHREASLESLRSNPELQNPNLQHVSQ